MKPLMILCLLLMSTIIAADVDAQLMIRWEASMYGSQVVPPNSSDGVAYMVCGYPPSYWYCPGDDPHLLEVDIDYYRLTPTGAEIRRGDVGINGETVLVLQNSFFPSGIPFSVLFDQEADCYDLDHGHLYVVIKTDDYPEGEVRGQLNLLWTPIRDQSWGRIRTLYR